MIFLSTFITINGWKFLTIRYENEIRRERSRIKLNGITDRYWTT